MGCGSSNINVIPVGEAPLNGETTSLELNNKRVLAPIPRVINANVNDSQLTTSAERCNSFTSHDSGYVDNEYKHIITENSSPQLVEKVEKEFLERNDCLDLAVNGRSCPKLYTAEEQRKIDLVEEEKSIEMLRNNGLVQTIVVKKENCIRFDVIDERLKQNANEDYLVGNNRLAPLKRIPPLLRTKSTSSQNETKLTHEQIAQKLEAANERKQQNLALNLKNKPIRAQTPIRQLDSEINERQKKLLEIRDQIRAKNALDATLNTPRTPRSQELASELEKFHSKAPENFNAIFD